MAFTHTRNTAVTIHVHIKILTSVIGGNLGFAILPQSTDPIRATADSLADGLIFNFLLDNV